MAHVMKHTKASCGHMFAHFDRRAEHISNENLDRTRTHLNYNLACHQQMDQGEFVRQRCAEVRCQNRKDLNVMVTWVVTAPKDLPEWEHKQFFKASYDFLQERYGKENVVSAYVHMDEVTPHMHFAFVPVTEDKKRGGEKVSAKQVVNRADLQTFHVDLQKSLERELGHEVNVLNEATKEGNQAVSDLKRLNAPQRLLEAEHDLKTAKELLEPVNAKYELVKGQLLEHETKKLFSSNVHPVHKKGLLGKETVTLPKEEYDKLASQAFSAVSLSRLAERSEEAFGKWQEEAEALRKEFRSTRESKRVEDLSQRCRELEKQNDALQHENYTLRKTEKKAIQEMNKTIEKVNKVLNRLPDQVADQFRKEWKAQERSWHSSRER